MEKIKSKIIHYKRTILLALVSILSITSLSITLFLVQNNQDSRSRAAAGPCELSSPILIDATEKEFLDILNAHRESLGAGPLRLSEKLTRAAQWQAEDMVANNYLSHTDSLGRGYEERLASCGTANVMASENIANGALSAQGAFNAWQASNQGHDKNMEDSRWTQTGIAKVVVAGRGRWVQTFSVGNDGTSPDMEDNNTSPSPTVTAFPTATSTPTGIISPQPTNTPQPTANPSLSPNPTQTQGPTTALNFSFKMPGIGGNTALGENPNPRGQGRGIEIQILDSSRKALETRTGNGTLNKANYTFDGTVNLPSSLLLPDNFLRISIPRAKPHEIIIKSLPSSNPLTVPTLLFRTGDMDNNGLYELNDYIDQIACVKQIRCEKGGEYYDLNSDGLIDVVDLNILMRAIRDFNQ